MTQAMKAVAAALAKRKHGQGSPAQRSNMSRSRKVAVRAPGGRTQVRRAGMKRKSAY